MFFEIYSSLDIGKVKKNVWLLHAYIYLGVVSSGIEAFQGFTSNVYKQFPSRTLILY